MPSVRAAHRRIAMASVACTYERPDTEGDRVISRPFSRRELITRDRRALVGPVESLARALARPSMEFAPLCWRTGWPRVLTRPVGIIARDSCSLTRSRGVVTEQFLRQCTVAE